MDMKQIGRNIKSYRERMGITQRELADQIMVSFQAISAWERGVSIPDVENVIRLAVCFGVSVDALLYQSRRELFVGIDGGGTKTEMVLFTENGAVENRVVCEGSNPNDRGLDQSIQVLTAGLEQLLRGQTPKTIFCGIGGVSLPVYQKEIVGRLSDRFRARVGADSDAANVLSMGNDPENSMAVICGTGSCVFVRKEGKRSRVGGWGYMLDPGGSAFDVGADALRCALAVEDNMIPPNALSQQITAMMGGQVFGNISAIYSGGRAYIASFAKAVSELAAAADPTALEILERNARRLGYLIRTAVDTYGEPAQIVGGGSFLGCQRFRTMVEGFAECRIEMPQLPPIYGACVEALRLEDRKPNAGFYEKFKESYRR